MRRVYSFPFEVPPISILDSDQENKLVSLLFETVVWVIDLFPFLNLFKSFNDYWVPAKQRTDVLKMNKAESLSVGIRSMISGKIHRWTWITVMFVLMEDCT